MLMAEEQQDYDRFIKVRAAWQAVRFECQVAVVNQTHHMVR